MTTTFIDNVAVPLALRYHGGNILDENGAEVLHYIWSKRLLTRLRYIFEKGETDPVILQLKAAEIAASPMRPYTIVDDAEENDPILLEAMEIARNAIKTKLQAEGLPIPAKLDIHARALVEGVPVIIEEATRRIEARLRAAALPLGAV
jgi:hypothetical protein